MEKENSKKIMENDVAEIKKLLKSGKVQVSVVGIGRIGLPTALSIANSGLSTIGVDINANLVNNINSGIFPLKDEPGYDVMFDEVMKKKLFYATTNMEEAIPKSNIILLSLPTPMSEDNVPDYSALRLVGKQLSGLMALGSILIVESTIEPGFIENEFIKIVEGHDKRLIAGENFGIGVCPETANPGEILKDFTKLPRLVAATNEKTRSIIREIYNHVFPVELIEMPDCKTANAVKLTTNVFRDINIAFMNELALLFDKLGIDTLTVLEAAKSKYNFQIHYPGAGVGGPCLPVNSYQMLNSARALGNNLLTLVKSAREVNEKMPNHVVDLILDAFKQANKPIESSTILILGVSYKPEVKDIQLTPAKQIIKKLEELGARLKIYDPYFKSTEVFGIKTEGDLINGLMGVDAAVIVTAHKEFVDLDPTLLALKMRTPVIVDSRGIIDYHAAKKAGLIFRGLGRGRS